MSVNPNLVHLKIVQSRLLDESLPIDSRMSRIACWLRNTMARLFGYSENSGQFFKQTFVDYTNAAPAEKERSFQQVATAFEARWSQIHPGQELPRQEKIALLLFLFSQEVKPLEEPAQKELMERVSKHYDRALSEKVKLVAASALSLGVSFGLLSLLKGQSSFVAMPAFFGLVSLQGYLSQNKDFAPVKCSFWAQKAIFLFNGARLAAEFFKPYCQMEVLPEDKSREGMCDWEERCYDRRPLSTCSFPEAVMLNSFFTQVCPFETVNTIVSSGVSLGILGYMGYHMTVGVANNVASLASRIFS